MNLKIFNRRGRLKVTEKSKEPLEGKTNKTKPKTKKISELDPKKQEKVIKKLGVKPPDNKSRAVNTPKQKTSIKSNTSIKKDIRKIEVDKRATAELKKYRFLTLRMYSYKIFNALLRGSIDKRNPNINGDNIQIGYSEVFTSTTVTRYFVLSYLPETLPVGFMNYVTNVLKQSSFWVKADLQIKTKKYSVDFNKPHIEGKLERWANKLDTEYSDVKGLDGKEYIRDLNESALRRKYSRLYRSYFKLRDNIGFTKEGTLIIKLQTKEKDEMNVAEKKLKGILKALKIEHYRINSTILDFLRAYSPISLKPTVTSDTASRVVLTDHDVASLTPYRQGKSGDFGLPAGFDRLSGSIVWLDLMSTPEAKNIFLWGGTGSGKTYLMRKFAVYHTALGHRIFFHDDKGNEYTEYTRAVGGLIISQTPSKSSFLNLWVIPTDEDDVTPIELMGYYTEMYGLAELEFLTLTEPLPEEVRDYKNIFADYWKHCHRSCEVYQDKIETYYRTKELTPTRRFELYKEFSGSQSVDVVAQYGQKTLSKIMISLHKYWHPRGARSELYRNEINLNELKQANVVCFDFGKSTTVKGSVPANESKLKYIFMNASCSRFVSWNNKSGLWTVKVIEELQEADEDMLKFTSDDVTIGRARSMINYVLGNATGSLASDSPYAQNILQSMTIQFLGKLKPSAREFCINNFDLQKMEKELEEIETNENYNRNFLLNSTISSSPVTAIVQTVATDRVNESPFFKTVNAVKHIEKQL